MTTNSDKDVCICGDYRGQHHPFGCEVCQRGTAPWDQCSGFLLAGEER